MTPDARNELHQELNDLKARLAAIETERQSRQRSTRRALMVVAIAFALAGSTVFAANGNCPNGLPFCFAQDTPAIASDVNHNFMQLKEWLEAKVGPVSTAGISATTITATGLVAVGTLQVPSGVQGTQVMWNTQSSGLGRTELINNKGLGSGGFYFYERQYTTSGNPTPVLDMNPSRANFSGAVGGNGALCIAHTACVEGNYVGCGGTTTCPNGKVMVGMTDGTSCSVQNRAQCCSLQLIACP